MIKFDELFQKACKPMANIFVQSMIAVYSGWNQTSKSKQLIFYYETEHDFSQFGQPLQGLTMCFSPKKQQNNFMTTS